MEKKQIISAVAVTAAFSIAILIGCKKEVTESKKNPAQGAVTQPTSPSGARLSAGSRSYYSKDDNDIVYRMDLTFNASGDATAVRSIYSTSQPDTIKTVVFAEAGIPLIKYNEDPITHLSDSLHLTLATGSKYFFIPFKPNVTPNEVIDGGYVAAYCQYTCSDPDGKLCSISGSSDGQEVTISCVGNCGCELVTSGCAGGGTSGTSTDVISVLPFGGYVLVEANSLSVTN